MSGKGGQRGGLSGLLRALLAPAEDPRTVFGERKEPESATPEAAIASLQGAIEAAHRTHQGILERRERVLEDVARLEAEARSAVQAGRDDLARVALEGRWLLAGQAAALTQQARAAELRHSLTELETRTARRDVERQIETARAQADAVEPDYANVPIAAGDPVEREPRAIERDGDVAASLARLKAEASRDSYRPLVSWPPRPTAAHTSKRQPGSARGTGGGVPAQGHRGQRGRWSTRYSSSAPGGA